MGATADYLTTPGDRSQLPTSGTLGHYVNPHVFPCRKGFYGKQVDVQDEKMTSSAAQRAMTGLLIQQESHL